MGTTNYGTQIKTVDLNADAADYTFNIRNVGLVPTGIYSGGILKIISGNSFKITPLIAEMLDSNANYQIKLKTLSDITLTASSTTPYVILNWTYSQTLGNNFVDVVLSGDTASYPYGIIVGKCIFSGPSLTGFVYYEQSGNVYTWQRSVPDDPRYKLKIEFDTDSATRNIWIFPGRVPNINGGNIQGFLDIPFQVMNIPTAGGVTAHVLYVNRSVAVGFVSVTRTTFSGSYSLSDTNSAVIAELIGVPASGGIPTTCLKDVRSYVR